MPCFLIHHRHESHGCGAASCPFGGHAIWWWVEAAGESEALRLLPSWSATRSRASPRRLSCCRSPSARSGSCSPPGAGGNLLRSTGFFDGAGAGGRVVVLACWVLAGVALLAAAALRDRSHGPSAAPAVAA